MTDENFQQAMLAEAMVFLRPLTEAATSGFRRREVFMAIGWDLDAISGFPVDSLISTLSGLVTLVQRIEQLVENPPQNFDDLSRALDVVGETIQIVHGLAKVMDGSGTPQPKQFDELGADLLNYLTVEYLTNHHPIVYALLCLLKIIDSGNPALLDDPVLASAKIVRYPTLAPSIGWERITKLLSDPVVFLKSNYLGVNGLATAVDAQEVVDRLFPLLGALFNMIGADVTYGRVRSWSIDLGTVGNQLTDRTLIFSIPLGSSDAEVGASLTLSSSDLGNLGLVIAPFGMLETSHSFSSWRLDLQLLQTVKAIAVGKQGVVLDDQSSANRFTAKVTLTKLAGAGDDGAAFLIGSTTGTRLKVGQFAIKVDANVEVTEQNYGILLEVSSASFVFSPGEGDGFLQKVLPPEGFRTDFDLAVGWSSLKGLYFRGSAGLEATLPIHTSLLGALTIESIYLSLGARDSSIGIAVAATASIKLGPFFASVERLGLKAKLTFPSEGGNLGPANLELGFKPPSGAGMAIDASAVVGGGYLFFDPDNEQYAGILQLEIQKIVSLKAIGLLTTRMPDGSKGFSLLVIISAEFPPIQLGFGFTLTGVGGLLGVNRTMVVDVLRSGLRNKTLGSILFPQKPVERAQQIISDLRSIFPSAPARFVFGPVARLGWGTKNLITAELGILLELPQPIRLVILGRLTLALPSEKSPVVLIHLDSLGVIDFDRSDLSLDATIYDSKIAIFALCGDMALRLNWGVSPSFAVAVGGFNPRFQPPPNFPQLNRLAISLATSDNPRIRLETYLALTANTFQFGARLDFYAEVSVKVFGTFSASAYLGFDALVQFAPLQFIVDIDGGVAIKLNGQSLFSASLHLSLSGPDPVHAWGEATFAFLGEHRIPFDLTISAGILQPPFLPADPLEKLIEELEASTNWSAQLPRDENMLVTLRKVEVKVDGQILAHPLGELTVSQKAVPLEVLITKFGDGSPTQGGPFLITLLQLGDQVSDQPRQTLRALYPPGQFFEMSDEEKLARPAFEALPSGCSRIGTTGVRFSRTQVKAIAQYDTVVIDQLEERQKRTGAAFAYTLPSAVQAALAGLGAAGQSAMRATGSTKYAGSDRQQVRLVDPAYVVASADDMSYQGTDKKSTYTEAEAARQQKGASTGRYQVVGAHEVS